MAIALSVIPVYAQFVPVVAKIKNTSVVTVAGKVIRTEKKDGVYYRNSDGSYYRQWTKVDDGDRPDTTSVAELFDNKAAVAYKLDLINHIAYEREKAPNPILPDALYHNNNVNTLPQDTVAGVRCSVMKTRLHLPDKPVAQIGETCMSIDYNLMLKQESNYPTPDGKVYHVIFEMYDVHLGTEPDPKLFDLKKFRVYAPQPAKN